MTDIYAVDGGRGRWRVLREGAEIAAYPTRDQALAVVSRLETAVLGVVPGRRVAGERRSFARDDGSAG